MPTDRLRRGGPSPHARLPVDVKALQGNQAYLLHHRDGLGFREIGRRLGVSATTAWRRYWFFVDFLMHPLVWDAPRDHVPPQRGTRECPRAPAAARYS